uniref:Uncharacterized protein n=1 Tax=Helianthus annuus TaxID=4232 RepID=A0A251U637_HELAN
MHDKTNIIDYSNKYSTLCDRKKYLSGYVFSTLICDTDNIKPSRHSRRGNLNRRATYYKRSTRQCASGKLNT